jgi:hypothetical protein
LIFQWNRVRKSRPRLLGGGQDNNWQLTQGLILIHKKESLDDGGGEGQKHPTDVGSRALLYHITSVVIHPVVNVLWHILQLNSREWKLD